MKVADLTWPQPGDPTKIAKWYQDGARGLIVARHQRTVDDWDMDAIGETLPAYISTVYVPRKLAGSPNFVEASQVTLYRMTGPDTMEEVVTVPFFSPPVEVKEAQRLFLKPVAEIAESMIAEMRRLMVQAQVEKGEPWLPFLKYFMGRRG